MSSSYNNCHPSTHGVFALQYIFHKMGKSRNKSSMVESCCQGLGCLTSSITSISSISIISSHKLCYNHSPQQALVRFEALPRSYPSIPGMIPSFSFILPHPVSKTNKSCTVTCNLTNSTGMSPSSFQVSFLKHLLQLLIGFARQPRVRQHPSHLDLT